VQFLDDPPQAHSDSELELRRAADDPRRATTATRSSGRRATGSPASDGGGSESTIEMPPRFDADGRPLRGGGDDGGERHASIPEAVDAFMRGRGARGFASVVDEMLGLRQGQRGTGRGVERERSRGGESDEYD
jgi:hypothetical protein